MTGTPKKVIALQVVEISLQAPWCIQCLSLVILSVVWSVLCAACSSIWTGSGSS